MNNNPKALPIDEQANRLLQFVSENYAEGSYVKTHLLLPRIAKDSSLSVISQQRIYLLLEHLSNSELIQWTAPQETFRVTANGYRHLETRHTNLSTSQAFVAMWFDDTMNNSYENGIRPAIEDTGYTPVRIDKKNFLGKIDDEIIAEIRRSRFVIADFSHGGDGVRGSVYYEAGFAHGLGIPVIYLCREGSTLAFDTDHYPHIIWSDTSQLREQLQNRILALLGEGPNHP